MDSLVRRLVFLWTETLVSWRACLQAVPRVLAQACAWCNWLGDSEVSEQANVQDDSKVKLWADSWDDWKVPGWVNVWTS